MRSARAAQIYGIVTSTKFWRGVFVQQEVAKLGQNAAEFPPMQKGASFNLEAVKEQIERSIVARSGN